MEQFCIITTSSYPICLKIILKNRLQDSSKDLNKNKPILVTVRYGDIFVLCLHAIVIYAIIQYALFSK